MLLGRFPFLCSGLGSERRALAIKVGHIDQLSATDEEEFFHM